MKARQAVVCPACGALSRPNWDFCARCGESLERAKPAEASARPPGAEPSSALGETPEGSSLPSSLVATVSLVALVLFGVAAWRYAATAPPPGQPDPGMFTVAPRPTDLPPAPPPPGLGGSDYEAGRRLLNARDLAGAVARLGTAVRAEPDNAEYRNAYASALWRSGDRARALGEYAEAARLDPRLQMQYARSLDLAGRSDDAVREYVAILARNPDASTVQTDLGRLLFRNGDYATAAVHLQAAVQKRHDDPVLQEELAYALDQAGDKAHAAVVYREVIEHAPYAATTRTLLADNLYQQGKKDEAMAVLLEGLKVTPNVPLLQRQVGSLLEQSGQAAEAAAAYRAYAKMAPNAPDAKDVAERAVRLETPRRTP